MRTPTIVSMTSMLALAVWLSAAYTIKLDERCLLTENIARTVPDYKHNQPKYASFSVLPSNYRQGADTSGIEKINIKTSSIKEIQLNGTQMSARIADPMSYKLDQTSRTSAGVYDGDRLVRTLWGNKLQSPGTYSLANAWDGTDDDGKAVADKSYTIKVLSNQVTYQWLAPIGNTSLDSTGPGVHHSMQLYTNMVQVGQDMYCANGYNEIGDSHIKFAIGQPNRLTTTLKGGCMVPRFMATDGQRVYYAGEARDDISFTTAIIPKPGGTDILYNFSNGRPVAISGNNSYKYSGIDYETNNNDPTGLAVQVKGDFLFVSHGSLNQLRVLNKNTGALVRTLTVTNPGELKINESTLWMMSEGVKVSRYTIGADGTLSPATLTLTGLTEPLAIGLSADGGTLAVCDRGVYHQVKIYETVDGRLVHTIGRTENYTNPTVYDDKFYFNNTRIFTDSDYGATHAFVSFQSDGSVWIGDYGNMRCQHFTTAGAYIDNIQYMGYSYSCQVDANNPTRVFSDFLEFSIDYATNKWRFVRNWSKNVTKPNSYDEDRMRSVATLANGRTYCLSAEANKRAVLELVSDKGLRHTGLYLDNGNSDMNSDGSQWQIGTNQLGKPTFWQRRPLTGFDSEGNPQWGPAVTVEKLETVTLSDPVTYGGYLRRQQYTTNKIIVGFSSDNGKTERGKGYHLGGVKNGQWLFRVSPSTRNDYVGDYPDDGAFDIGNGVNYAASFMQVVDSSIFWGYKGENWKQGQTNMYQHYLDNGLMVGQFGVTQEIARLEGEAPAQMAGNANSGSYVKVGSDIHFFHCDEGQHAGVHHWKISNVKSIRTQAFSVTPLMSIPLDQQGQLNCINLMESVPESGTISSGTGRWQYEPVGYYKGAYDQWQAIAGRSTYRKGERSLRFVSYPTINGKKQQVTCNLSAQNGKYNQFESWTLTGSITYPELSEVEYNYVEILDHSGKVILQLSRSESYPYASIIANGKVIVKELMSGIMSKLLMHAQPLEFHRLNETVQVTYGKYPSVEVKPLDSGADINKPSQLRVRFYSANTRGHQVDLANLKLCYMTAQAKNSCTTIKDGVWTDPSVWLCNRIPSPTDIVYLKHNLVVPVNYTAYVEQVVYIQPVKLTYMAGAYILLNNK